MGKVIPLGNVTKLDIPTDAVLEQAKSHCSDGVVIMGYDDDGSLYFASSIADGGTVVWLAEMMKRHLFKVAENV